MARGVTATISIAAFRADWMTHMPMRALCQRYTISRDQVIRLKHHWELPPRHDRRLRAKPVRQPDPSQSEIRKRCLEIQASWSAEVRADRCVYKRAAVSMQRIELTPEARDAIDALVEDEP